MNHIATAEIPKRIIRSAKRGAARKTVVDPDAPKIKTTNILLIEDSMAVANLIVTKLQEVCTAKVIHCSSLADARRVFNTEHFASAITGLDLPDGKGEEILAALDEAEIAALVYTAKHDDEAQHRYGELQLLGDEWRQDLVVDDGRDDGARAGLIACGRRAGCQRCEHGQREEKLPH